MNKFILTILLPLFFLIGCVQPTAPLDDNLPDSLIASNQKTDVLVYGGPGTWRAEIASLKKILADHGATYEVVTNSDMDSFSVEDFLKFHAVLFVGGDAPTVTRALSAETHAHLREAVQEHGLDYLGFCAGAWMAVAPAPEPGHDTTYGLGVVSGPLLQLNYLSKSGKEHALDDAVFPDGSHRKLLWYGGPITPDIPNGVVARYSDGTPAITQIRSGKGFVIISGLHPAATQPILDYLKLYEREAIDPDFAWQLLDAVIHRQPLSTF
jgi:glutamine amidotransferase-like uncharacterized protein